MTEPIEPQAKEIEGRVVVVVDDDEAVRDSTATLLEQAGHKTYQFESGDRLIEAGVPVDADIVLLDILMPGSSGLETLAALNDRPGRPQVVMITGHGDVPLAVEAMKLGAVDFLEKPYPMQALLELVGRLGPKRRNEQAGGASQAAADKVRDLTPRQCEILKGMAIGEPSKVTAHRLALSVRTVEAYRGHIFKRLGVRGMAEAVRIAVLAGLADG